MLFHTDTYYINQVAFEVVLIVSEDMAASLTDSLNFLRSFIKLESH